MEDSKELHDRILDMRTYYQRAEKAKQYSHRASGSELLIAGILAGTAAGLIAGFGYQIIEYFMR